MRPVLLGRRDRQEDDRAPFGQGPQGFSRQSVPIDFVQDGYLLARVPSSLK